MNSIKEAIIAFKSALKAEFENRSEIHCEYMHGGHKLSGAIIQKGYYYKVHELDTLKPTVLVRSLKTAKEYNVLISNILTVSGIQRI